MNEEPEVTPDEVLQQLLSTPEGRMQWEMAAQRATIMTLKTQLLSARNGHITEDIVEEPVE